MYKYVKKYILMVNINIYFENINIITSQHNMTRDPQ